MGEKEKKGQNGGEYEWVGGGGLCVSVFVELCLFD